MLMQRDGRVQVGNRMMVVEGSVAEPSPEGIMKARGVRGKLQHNPLKGFRKIIAPRQ